MHVLGLPGVDPEQGEKTIPFEFQLELVDLAGGDHGAGGLAFFPCIRDHDADEIILFEPQVPGGDVGRVADLRCGGEDQSPFSFAQSGVAVESAADRPDGDTGQFGKLFQSCGRHIYPVLINGRRHPA